MFGWARDQAYGLNHNIAADIKPLKIIGAKVSRERALSTDEVRALWAAASAMPYPYGPAYQLLILTGLRLNECVRARWSEINLKAGIGTIPAVRMKGKAGKATSHVVPLTKQMIEILDELPHFTGEYVFSTDAGEKPISLGSKIKDKLDAKLQFDEPWQNHDLRRTIRSGLAELGIKEEVSEAVLGHRQPGIRGVYNQHKYLAEKRDALTQWGAVVAPPSNVTPLRKKRHA